jgi:hypothetical protein
MLSPRRARLSRVVATIAVAAAWTLAGEAPARAQGKSTTTRIGAGGAAAPLRIVVPSNGVFTSPFFWVPVGGAILTAVLLTSSSPITSSNTATVTLGVKE